MSAPQEAIVGQMRALSKQIKPANTSFSNSWRGLERLFRAILPSTFRVVLRTFKIVPDDFSKLPTAWFVTLPVK